MIAMTQNIKRMVQILVPKHKAVNSAALDTIFHGFLVLFKCPKTILRQFSLGNIIRKIYIEDQTLFFYKILRIDLTFSTAPYGNKTRAMIRKTD